MTVATVRSYLSTRPEGHPDRLRCITFTDGLPSAGLHPVIAATLLEYRPIADRYQAARDANETAATRAAADSRRVDQASVAFVRAFGRWIRKIDDANDRTGHAAAALRSKVGDRPISVFLASSGWDRVARMKVVFAHVDDMPSLLGTPETHQALKEATDALREALGDRDDARSDRSGTVKALARAGTAFDQIYGLLVKNMRRFDPKGLGAAMPTFRRARKVEEMSAPASPEGGGVEPGAEAPVDGDPGSRPTEPERAPSPSRPPSACDEPTPRDT